jgi:hypothetical protein
MNRSRWGNSIALAKIITGQITNHIYLLVTGYSITTMIGDFDGHTRKPHARA